MPVQSILNLSVRKTRSQRKAVVQTSDEENEQPRQTRRNRKQEQDPPKQAQKRSSPTKQVESSPPKRSPPPTNRSVNAPVRNLFSDNQQQTKQPLLESSSEISENKYSVTRTPEKNRTPLKSVLIESTAAGNYRTHDTLEAQNLLERISSPSTNLRSPKKAMNSPLKSPVKQMKSATMNQLNASPAKSTRSQTSPTKKIASPSKNALKVAKADSSLYSQARHSLHTQLTDLIIGRDDEIKKLTGLIGPALRDKKAQSVYISGAPGTGKTVSLTHILDQLSKEYKFSQVFINCMTIKTLSSVYSKINDGLKFNGTGLDGVQEGVKKHSCVIVLDEVDQLQSTNQQVLYSLFELAKLKGSKVVLVGIANALDLTDKTVPLLQAYGCRPHLHHFAPYNDKQIVAILKSRLSECSSVIKPMALNFLAKKIASCTGDVRKALDICRKAVENVERQVRQQRILAARAEGTPGATQQVLVDISHISQVISDVFNTRARGNQNLHTTLPLQQKLLLCAILVCMKRKNLKEITLGKLQEVYSKVCKIAKVAAIDYSELQSICTLLEARALVSIKKAKESRQSKVRLAIDEAEVEQVLQDKSILANCMTDAAIC